MGKRFISRFRLYSMVGAGRGVCAMLVSLSLGWCWNHYELTRLRDRKKSWEWTEARRTRTRKKWIHKNKLKLMYISHHGSCSHGWPGKEAETYCHGLWRDITLPTKVCLVKAMVFPVIMYGCESWTVKKASTKELMLLNCSVGEDSWESLWLQGDPTSQS